MLNRTSRGQVDTVLCTFLQHWSNAEAVSTADWKDISNVIAPLGIRHRRALGIIRFSKQYLLLMEQKQKSCPEDARFHFAKREILSLHQCGEYAFQAYRIFAQRRLIKLTCDHALQDFVDYKRAQIEL
jgi:hypothetical protein